MHETFRELIDEKWIVPVDRNVTSGKVWYLPFFVTKQEKARVVYDGAATFKGKCLNQAVLARTNLLNNLGEVLIRFRIGRYACIADFSKCFFQVAIPETQRDLFRIIWFKDNDIDIGEKQTFCFTKQVWGINSSPYIALTDIKNVVNENVTGASQMTLMAIEKNRYMDRAGQVRKLVRKSANPQLRTNEKSCGLADFGSLNCGLAVADYFKF